MSKLELEIVGYNDALENMQVNGKNVKIKFDKKTKGKTCTVDVKEDVAEIMIYKTHHYTGKAWFWWNLLYFFLSVFGIFDIHHDKKFIVYDCRFSLKVEEDTKATIKVLNFKDGEALFDIQSEKEVEIISNKAFYDADAKKKHKIMKWSKLGIGFGVLVAIVLLVILL